MGVESIESNNDNNICDDAKNDARLNVLFSPFRKREVNPQDWESKMNYWKENITKFCMKSNSCVFSLIQLQSSFVRNGRPASCLNTVIDDMLRNNEIIRLQELLGKDPTLQSWSTWAVNCFVKAPIVWSFTKLKESLIANPNNNYDGEYVHLTVLKKQSELLKGSCWNRCAKPVISFDDIKSLVNVKDELSIRVILHWLQLQGQAAVTTVNNKTIVKLSSGNEPVKPFSEADIGLYQLQQNEQALINMLEQLEKEKQQVDQETRNYLKKGMRQVAKTCLRKRKELEKCIEKRASALENVQVLLSRVKEAESDGEILESYKMGLSALKSTFKDAGLSEESVGCTMDQVKEVLEAHEEIQSALSEPMADSIDRDLENELAELLSESKTNVQQPVAIMHSEFPDLPEPPSHSPTISQTKTSSRSAQLLQ